MNSEPEALILQVAVPGPLHGCLDYLAPPHCSAQILSPGMRVHVPFGKRKAVGVLIQTATHSRISSQRLRPALSLLDHEPLLSPDLLELSAWASRYYHHPLGEVMSALLPTALRSGQAATLPTLRVWRITSAGKAVSSGDVKRAPRQAALLDRLQRTPDGLAGSEISKFETSWHSAMHALVAKGWAECLSQVAPPAVPTAYAPQDISLNAAQCHAVNAVCASLDGFASFLLDGVTSSGKTEVYLQIIRQVVAAGRQALVLVPEIGLTPQLINRFSARLGHTLAVLHSGLNDSERLHAWLLARNGQAPIIIGTRSAVFTPL